LQILKFCICWQFWSKHLYACHQYLETVFDFTLLACGIGEYSTVHFSVTLQSKFWMNSSRIWLFVDNFGAWKMQFGSLKSAWILYFEYAMNPVRFLSFLQIHIVSLMNLPVLSVSIALTLSQSFAYFHYRYDPVCSFEDWYASWKVLKSLVIFRPVIFCSVSRSCIVLERHLSHGIYGVVLWSKVLNFTALVGV